MANKPDKFVIKFWIAVDLESKYVLNAIPYLGKVETRPDTQRLSESVVIKLEEPCQPSHNLDSLPVQTKQENS